MHNADSVITEAQSIYAMCKIEWDFSEKRCDVNVAATKVNALPAGDVEISRHFVERQRTVYAACVEVPIWFICAFWQIVSNSLIPFIYNLFENNVLSKKTIHKVVLGS